MVSSTALFFSKSISAILGLITWKLTLTLVECFISRTLLAKSAFGGFITWTLVQGDSCVHPTT
jgi:hypothetical protein